MSRRWAVCGREIIHLGEGEPPSLCEDCRPETGPGSRLVDQLATNLRRFRRDAGITAEEWAGVPR